MTAKSRGHVGGAKPHLCRYSITRPLVCRYGSRLCTVRLLSLIHIWCIRDCQYTRRELEGRALARRRKGAVRLRRFEKEMAFVKVEQALIPHFSKLHRPVSYTHLDVYMRQVWTASTARWTTSQRSLNSAVEWGCTSVRCALQAAPSAAFKGRRAVLRCV